MAHIQRCKSKHHDSPTQEDGHELVQRKKKEKMFKYNQRLFPRGQFILAIQCP